MSTIAIALGSTFSDEQKREAEDVAQGFGYGISFDVARAEDEVRDGLVQAGDQLGWRQFVFLHARISSEMDSAEYDSALASRIEEELFLLESEGVDPAVFDFLRRLDALLLSTLGPYWVVFAGEWYRDERIRLEAGTLSQLITRLGQPGNWRQRLWVVATGTTQDSDEVPLVFHVRRETAEAG